jgi:hypothetical protein
VLFRSLDGLITSDKFPRPLPDLFWGSQVVQLGLYDNSGDIAVKLNAMMRGRPVQLSSQVYFESTPGGYSFVPRLWAQAKIDYLLEQIAMYGEQPELKNQVIELSLKFQILTPYTAFYSDPTTRIEYNDVNQKPTRLTLEQNYPNPFNPFTTMRYEIPGDGTVWVRIYDISGRLIKELYHGEQKAGTYTLSWDGTDAMGRPVPSGIYFYQLCFNNGKTSMIETRKMSLVK